MVLFVTLLSMFSIVINVVGGKADLAKVLLLLSLSLSLSLSLLLLLLVLLLHGGYCVVGDVDDCVVDMLQ